MQYFTSISSSYFVVLYYDFHSLISLKIKNVLVPDEFKRLKHIQIKIILYYPLGD